MKKIEKILTKYWKKILATFLLFKASLLLGVVFYQQDAFQAKLNSNLTNKISVTANTNTVNIETLKQLFPNLKNFKELEITNIKSNKFLVEFFASSKTGSSLHPYSYIITFKNGDFYQKIYPDEEIIDVPIDIAVIPILQK